MAEYKLFDGDVPYVSTAEFHADRERAPHLEQPTHRPRLELAADFVRDAVGRIRINGRSVDVVDLGCGDGGLLSLLRDIPGIVAWGYDFQPSNQAGWAERGVDASLTNVFHVDESGVVGDGADPGDVAVCTEVLEHLADPHRALRWIEENSHYVVASSPWTETAESHDACHAWAWDMDGYREMFENAGFHILRHEKVGMFQVILGYAP